jgi:hypothetical protein
VAAKWGGEPWHVGIHVDGADASPSPPTHSHTQAVAYRAVPFMVSRERSTHPRYILWEAGPPRQGDPESGDKVRKCHLNT